MHDGRQIREKIMERNGLNDIYIYKSKLSKIVKPALKLELAEGL